MITTNEFGCRDTVVNPLTIRGAPEAFFPPIPPLACAPYHLVLPADTTQAIRYEWYLNDALLPSVGIVLDTVLEELIAYDIQLVAIFDELCRDTFTRFDALQLEQRPIADFDFVADDSINVLGDVRFINLSQFAEAYYWELDEGVISREFAPYYEYGRNRDILVRLAATTVYPGGLVCSDTIARNVAPEWLTRFWVPRAFAPESTGFEYGQFGAKGVGVAEYTLNVFSPFGQLVFQTSELDGERPSGRWDGTYPDSNDFVLQGVYTWRAIGKYVNGNPISRVGTVTVLR
ncbi:MAG: hypothetical protein AAFU67_05630 [Bacteroidota bacterium]